MNNFYADDFLKNYNNLLSKARLEHKDKFAALASPTLNKQETISFLYQQVVCDGKNNVNYIGHFQSVIFFIPRLFYHLIHLIKISYSFKISSIPSNAILIRTWLVPRSIMGSRVRDDFFRQLVDDLRTEHSVIVGFQPLNYGSLLGKFKALEKHQNDIILIGLLNIVDILNILIDYVFSAKLVLKDEYFFRGRDIRDIINKSLSTDYFRLRSFQAYLDKKVAMKLKKYQPKYFLYIYENQAWEKAYLDVFNGSSIINIGYQTSGFSLRFLNFFPTELDKKYGIFPDKIYTVGESYTEILKKNGNYPIPITTFAALRFDYPTINGKYLVGSTIKKIHKKIIYAFAVHIYQYSCIIEKLVSVFGDSEIEVWLKFHPLFNPDKIQEVLPSNFKIWKVKCGSLKDNYDFILFNDNSFGVESLMEGVKSYQFDFGELYPETRLLNFTAYDAVADTDRLRSLKEELCNGNYEKEMNHEAIVKYINQHYKPYDKGMISFFHEKSQ